MCPYARFQSAMFDKDTLIIGYDEERGEKRGKHKKGESSASLFKGIAAEMVPIKTSRVVVMIISVCELLKSIVW